MGVVLLREDEFSLCVPVHLPLFYLFPHYLLEVCKQIHASEEIVLMGRKWNSQQRHQLEYKQRLSTSNLLTVIRSNQSASSTITLNFSFL
jgi:hypothetical protein